MSLKQLQIFAEKRDAAATLKGYEFQHLKTLESWINNRLNNIEEIIYCDFEEDIFHRDLAKGESKFRQIKLYSTDFSFSSDAIQETIANFFMLFVKGDYMLEEMIFSFETNASVVGRVVKDNDADLLQAWAANQQNLSGETLQRVRARVLKILQSYIQKEYEAKIQNVNLKLQVQQAEIVFNKMTDEILDKFIQSIQWNFEGLSSDEAVENQINKINSLIERIPLPITNDVKIAFSLLYRAVVTKSYQADPEMRKLTNELIDMILLESGDEKEKWYAELYAKWKDVQNIPEFHLGQFYEIIDAERYYRMNFHKLGHNNLWMSLLKKYIDNEQIKPHYRRKAIYEFIFLALNPTPVEGDDILPLRGCEDWVKYYFNEWEHRNNLADIHEDISLLQIVLVQSLIGKIEIQTEEINKWRYSMHSFIEQQLKSDIKVDDRCILLELKGDFEFHTNVVKSRENSAKSIDIYRQILPLLPQAELYSVSSMFDTFESMISLLIQFKADSAGILLLENFMEEIQEAAVKSGQRHIAAKNLAKRGYDYLSAGGLHNFLQALTSFHKAKSLWLLERTKEGYILALINIGQVYTALGMNIAAKYYALCAIWVTWHSKDESIFNRLAQATGLIFINDYKQGAWMQAIEDFELFINARNNFNPNGWIGNGDEMFKKALVDMSFLIYASKKLFPQISYFVDFRSGKWEDLWREFIAPQIEQFEKSITDETQLLRFVKRHLQSDPLSDVGPLKVIAFNALHIDWRIEFANTYLLTAIGEEFASSLQIFLCELARLNSNFLEPNKSMAILIEEAPDYQQAKNNIEHGRWIVSIPKFESKEQKEISYHYGFISVVIKKIFRSISTFGENEFEDFWWRVLHEEGKVGEKAFNSNAYQKEYCTAVDSKVFTDSQRAAFPQPPPHLAFERLPRLLVES